MSVNVDGNIRGHTQRDSEFFTIQRSEFFIVTVLVITYFAWLAWPVVGSAAENIRLVSVFSADEAVYGRLVEEAMTHPLPWAGQSPRFLKNVNPDLVIVNQAVAARFAEIDQATQYDRGQLEFMEKYEYYKGLQQETLGYRLVHDFGDVQVYEKQ